MEKPIWGKIILEALVTVLLTAMFTYGLSYFISRNQCNINIGTSILNDNEVMTPITITNSSTEESIENLEISVDEYNEIVGNISSLSYQIDNKKKILIIDYIPPKATVSIILLTKEIVRLNGVKITYEGNLITTYLENKSDTYLLIFTQAILYFIMLIGSQYIYDKKQKKFYTKMETIKETLEESIRFEEKELERVTAESDRLNKENDKNKKELHKLRIYYLMRMKAYAKELDFWKDTIRKLLYQCSTNKKSNEKIFDVVTETLKTYGTRSNKDLDIDELNYLAKMMSEIEKDVSINNK